MPNYHLSIKIFSRGKGDSIVEKAAYRSGEKLTSDYNGQTYDYTRKRGVTRTEILLPEHAPREYADRTTLWDAVENSERNGNAQLAREIEFSLPRELTAGQNLTLAREFIQKTFVDKGMAADVCYHDKDDGNPHVHIMLTLRPFNEDGTWAAKSRKEYILDENGGRIRLPSGAYKSRKVSAVDWNEQYKSEEWRAAWADFQNAALKRHGIDVTVDHRSYERQGIDKIPGVHLGPIAAQLERMGKRTDRGDLNRAAAVTNSKMRQQGARIRHAKDWLYNIPIQDEPQMIDMMSRVASVKNFASQAATLRNLKTSAKVLMFIQNNGIDNIAQFAEKVEEMNSRHYEVSNAIKEKTRRINTLTKHLEQNEIHQRTKAVFNKYQQLAPKKRDSFEAKHAGDIQLFRDSAAYFKDVMNGRKDPLPIRKWKAELETLTAERYALHDEYYRLDDELKSAEALIRGAKDIMREEPQREHPARAQDMAL